MTGGTEIGVIVVKLTITKPLLKNSTNGFQIVKYVPGYSIRKDKAGIGFGGLGVACWPLVPKFAGSNAAETFGFLGRKNPQHSFLRRGSKAVGPMS